jgi:uncharacterized membrane protein YhiD involved in acid resistance
MYVDGLMLLAIYLIAVLAMAISVYALWTLKEVEELYKKKNSKPNNAWDHYHNKAKQKPRAKGHWN